MTELRAASFDGTGITALDEGEGPTLLVVHPGGGDATSWDQVSRQLRDRFRVVRVRRRIYVPGAHLAPTHSMAVEAADVLAVAALLDRPVLLVGHSSGAVAALEAELRAAPGTFAGLVVYEPPVPTRALVAGEAGRRARLAFEEQDPEEAMKIHLRDIVQLPTGMVDLIFRGKLGRQRVVAYAAAQLTDNQAIDGIGVGTARFAALGIPTTLIEGDRSPVRLRERVADLAAVLPDARVVTLPGQGHFAHLTGPEALADAIREAADRIFGD